MRAAALALAALAMSAVAVPAQAATGRTAYVTNFGSSSVTPIDTATNQPGDEIGGFGCPTQVAITPNGATAFVADPCAAAVIPIATATNTTGNPITVGSCPFGIAITPNGAKAYVTDECNNTVTPIDTATGKAGNPIPVSGCAGIALTPDGTTAYVANPCGGSVIPIDTATNTAGSPITAGICPFAIATTPDGASAYVSDECDETVTPIDTATNTAGNPISVAGCAGIAIAPDGATAYVADPCDGAVIPIDTATNAAGNPIAVGGEPFGIAITPDGASAYVTDLANDTVVPFNTATRKIGDPIPVGFGPFGIAITPAQAPIAAFSATAATVGQATGFDATGSSDPDGTVANYAWDFGDGSTASTGSAAIQHSYAAPGVYTATLTVTDDEGCSTALIFTGQTASCNGSGRARIQHRVVVSKASPILTTMASRPVTIGGKVRDTVTLSGGAAPTGKVVVRLYRPGDDDCSGPAAFGNRIAVSGNGSYRSALFTPRQVGIFRWTAAYTGDANNEAASQSCGSRQEAVWVQKASPSLTTQASITKDHRIGDRATLGSGRIPTGQVTFRLYGPGDNRCSSPIFTDKARVNGNGAYHSARFAASSPGTYRFTARYSGDRRNRGAQSPCNADGESVTIPRE